MARRIPYSKEISTSQDLREQVFRSRFTIRGKVSNFVIDGGSCANVASTTLVEKPGLQLREHPHPYHLQSCNG